MFHLLLVDDEKMVLLSIQNSVDWKVYGFSKVRTTSSPREACRLLQEQRIDVAFLDIRMPEMTAFDIVNFCREKKINPEFIALTGHSEFEYAHQAIHLGFFDYLLKPLLPEESDGFMNRLRLKLMQNRLNADPSIYSLLIENKNPLQLLTWMGCNFSRPFFYIVSIYADIPSSFPPFIEQSEYAVLFLSEKQILLFITSDESSCLSFLAFFSNIFSTGGISLYEIKDAASQLSASMIQASMESETLYQDSQTTHKLQLQSHSGYKTQLFNVNFLHLVREVQTSFHTDLSLSELTKKYNLNYTYCCELFHQLNGTTFSKYVTALRINQAKQLLEKTSYPIHMVSEKSGFSDYFYFAKVFKNTTGFTPSEYRIKKGCTIL